MTEPTTVALTIHVTAPNPGDAQSWAQAIADHVTGEFGDSMRLRIAITDPDYTPPPPDFPGPFQVWPIDRILREVAVGSGDWSWGEEWADLDQRHATTGYLDKLQQQIKENGITMPVLIGTDGRLWDGHHRLCVAVRLGIAYIPVEITPPAAEVAA